MRGACKSFTVGQEVVVALDGVDFALAAGELAVVYGASGCSYGCQVGLGVVVSVRMRW